MQPVKSVVLCILDGWGLSNQRTGNAPMLAKTPHFDRIMAECPNNTLITYGVDVGLPEGQMGNSEVGHMNIGAGRVVAMDLREIDHTIDKDMLAQKPGIRRLIQSLSASGGTAHLMGIMSDGGVHAHIEHMTATAKILAAAGIPVALHVFTDGRDVGPKSAMQYLARLQPVLKHPNIHIATVCGRYFPLDRDNRWDRVSRAYRTIALGAGNREKTAKAAITSAYQRGETDEFIRPTAIGDYRGIEEGDGVLCLNFRADRARELLAALAAPDFIAFETGIRPKLSIVSGFTSYSQSHDTYMDVVFPKENIANTLGAWVAQQGLHQFRIAETEKYPHVTFFLNGGKESAANGETRYLAPSLKIATYDLQPSMSAPEVTNKLTAAIRSGDYALLVVNYANPDMVGHTGDLDAAIAACETVDLGLGEVLEALNAVGGKMIVTADHGNCETMIDKNGGPHTAHTTNPVPVVLVGLSDVSLRDGGRLADLAPTLLELMKLPTPPEMTGVSLMAPGQLHKPVQTGQKETCL